MFFEWCGLEPVRKICGVTNSEDALMVQRMGAEALGVNLYKGSKRFVELSRAREWLLGLEGKITRVAVVVNPAPEEVVELSSCGFFDGIQFHGDECPEFCAACGFRYWIKAVRVRDEGDLRWALGFKTPYLLLDGWVSGNFGGSGVRVDWKMAADFVRQNPDRRVILAGGLTPGNIHSAVWEVGPYGVDVSSGVEISPGKKDEVLVSEFLGKSRGGTGLKSLA